MKKIIILILFIFITTGCSSEEKVIFEPNKVNLNEHAIEDKQVNNLIFYDTSIIYDQGMTTLKTKIKNNSSDINIQNINIDCYSKNGTKIITLQKKLNKIIKTDEEIKIVLATDIDLTDIYEIKYNID